MTHYITFPKLFDTVLSVPQDAIFGIKWYAIMIMLGFLLAALYGMARAKQFNTDGDTVADLLLFALPAAIIGARAYYVLNMWGYYSQNLGDIIKIWEGGLAIYGGIIAGIVTVLVYGKFKKLDILSFLDMGGIAMLLGQAIGRWGNFFNAEAFGTATDLPWGMVIRQSVMSQGIAVHPTFLYEFLWNMLGFGLLHWYSKRRKFRGEVFLMYIGWYGLGRGFIEGLRTDSLFLGSTDIRISQVLAFASFVVAAGVLIYFYVTKKYKPIDHTVQPILANEDLPFAPEGQLEATESQEINPTQNEDSEPVEPCDSGRCDCETEAAIAQTTEEIRVQREHPEQED